MSGLLEQNINFIPSDSHKYFRIINITYTLIVDSILWVKIYTHEQDNKQNLLQFTPLYCDPQGFLVALILSYIPTLGYVCCVKTALNFHYTLTANLQSVRYRFESLYCTLVISRVNTLLSVTIQFAHFILASIRLRKFF